MKLVYNTYKKYNIYLDLQIKKILRYMIVMLLRILLRNIIELLMVWNKVIVISELVRE
jgi:hypothetical protein